MAKSAKRDKQKIESQEKADKALQLRKQGLDYRSIGRVLGIDYTWASRLVKRAIAEIPKENAEDCLEIEKERLDRLQAAYWQKALAGDVRSGELFLKVSESRRRLLGLDAAKDQDGDPGTLILRISAEVARAAPSQPKVPVEVANAADPKNGQADSG